MRSVTSAIDAFHKSSERLSARLGGRYASLWFAASVLVALLAFSGATYTIVRRQSVEREVQNAQSHVQLIAQSIVSDNLRPSDVASPVSTARRRQLDQLFRHEIPLDGLVQATVFGPDGHSTYSTEPSLIGGPAPDPALLSAAQHGSTVSIVAALASASQPKQKVLQTYVPLVAGGTGTKPVGTAVFELSQTYSQIVAAAQQSAILVTEVVAVILLAICGCFFAVLRLMTHRIRGRMKDMEDHVEEMEHYAFHDPLTGLPNRALFYDRVEMALQSAQRTGATVAVMVMDLDRFKEINDTFGHDSGDQLLREVAHNLRAGLRQSDSVARLGGDEFAILAPSVAGPLGAITIAERALEALQRPHEVAGTEVDVDASIGVALHPHHGQGVDALLRCADIALYVSKANGEPALYAVEHDHHSAETLALSAQLRRAIAQREITLYYQPQVDFKTGKIRGVEAVVRWEHPTRGLLLPAQFVPLAERTGLIRAMTSVVLDLALEQSSRWCKEGLEVAIAVNITDRDLLDQRFPYEVRDLLEKWRVDASLLELEITENTVLTDPVRARSVLVALNDLGVRLAIDDFGIGSSSLGYLKRLPVNVLKIDKSFVLQMLVNDDDAVIVRSTIDLGHNLGLEVVAEGVENSKTWEQLRELGCDIGQGFYFSTPAPGPRIGKLLKAMPHQPDMGRVRPLVIVAGQRASAV